MGTRVKGLALGMLALTLPAAAQQLVVATEEGSFVIGLLPQVAPKHVAHFLEVAKAGGFDGTTFHRVIRGGIVQGGDPLTRDPKKESLYGSGGLGLLKAEFSDRPFARGVVAAVRRPRDIDSAGQQFFVVLTEQPALKGQFTILGEVVEGIEVADKLGETPVEGERATLRVEMRVTLRPAP